ncbi:MAG TPA: AfsR/SARP family transcriptional regulator [Candidatus Dormibacteraeota bacterium]|nr:AfsR/SARP family transcriptional regulator [Candidatus Dormibacteraeota bacterium]
MSKQQIEFRVLGPLEVWDGERQLTLGSARQRALLGTLLLHAGDVVDGDRLAEAVWGTQQPERPANALRTHVTALRRLLEPVGDQDTPSILAGSAAGWRLCVDPEQVDLHRFERLVEQGRRAMSGDPIIGSGLLHQAASLWRGPALGDVTLAGAAAAECARIDALRVDAVEDRLGADLELGRHAAVIGELEALVAAHPQRERLHALRVLALHRCGRRADALAAYAYAAEHLEPSPDLQSLEQAILAGDPGLAAPAPGRDDTVIGTLVPRTVAPAPNVTAPATVVTAAATVVSTVVSEAETVVAAPVVTVAAPTAARPVRRTAARRRTLAGMAALVLGSGAAAVVVHTQHANASPQAAATDAFPTQQERLLIGQYGAAVTDCHRYPLHYAKALADVECHIPADHPGARTLLLQSFTSYDDLELHFHHVLGLTIQEQTGRPVTAAYHGDCADSGSGFFALGNHRQDGAQSANGHLMCYVDRAGVPHLAWSDVTRLTVSQATGGSGADAQPALLAFWRNLYPGETVYAAPATTAVTTAAHGGDPSPAAAVEQVAQVTPGTVAGDPAAASQPQIAPTPSATPAPATHAPAPTHPAPAAATPAPSPAASAAPSSGHGSGSWKNGWDSLFGHHGHD